MAEMGFWKLAQEDPGSVAVIDPDGAPVTRGELVAAANRVTHGLRALGLDRGDTVALVMPNSVELLTVYLAGMQMGLFVTPINHHLVGPEIAYIVSDSEAKAFVTHERFADAVRAAADEIDLQDADTGRELGGSHRPLPLSAASPPGRSGRLPAKARFAIGHIDGFRSFTELGEGQPDTTPEGRSSGMAMHYTSGTTGRPKGVKRGMADMDPDELGSLFAMFLMMFGVQPGDGNVHITGSPLYHTAVLMWTASSMHLGHPVVLMDRWTPEGMLELIDRHRVTTSHMVPTQFHRLLALPEEVRKSYDVSSLRCMVHAAAPCPPEIKRRMIDWWGDAVAEYYAATEGGGTIVTAAEWLERPGTVGKAWAGSEVRILDDDANLLGPGEVGTVYLALAQADFEYKGDEAKTKANRRDGFFTVGDVGELDADGYLFLRDRKTDMIISGGVNIYPAEIEGVLLTHPSVGDAAVFGIPHDDWGEEIKAIIEPGAGVEPTPELEADIGSFCDDKLAKFKRPRTIDFIAEMPRDPSGKLFKRRLRDPYWTGRDRAI